MGGEEGEPSALLGGTNTGCHLEVHVGVVLKAGTRPELVALVFVVICSARDGTLEPRARPVFYCCSLGPRP